ncbi:hypothetical protein PSTG_04205 [Puccinia striiformis f. sp. tritici PST-78]|uniref:CxC1-like cysteine cluster associated with KDZ transposases domain-containing protein n=1 Tax=Puccinia striiformis f. sp. tritici PST-78 TaxID=1165861 RepID=A0A0L0VTL0_9BASI|nr:hypothetical protein PSTG_04205 [Puccinia striiformis f. sp. tritici PST-78]
MAGNTKKRTGKLKMKTPTIATRAQRLRREKNCVEYHSSYLRIFANQDSLRHERERQEDMVGDHLMENTYEPNPEQLEDDATSSSSEDDIQWVNVELEPPRPIDLAIEACKEKFRREARELNWNNVTQLLHPAFMTMKSRTNNWSRTLDINPMPKCICSSKEKTTRIVDLVDIFGQYRKPFEFCKCTDDAARLIYHGYLAASPQIPQTAFSLPLLTLHNSLWNHCHVSILPFTLALTEWLEPRSERLRVKNRLHARDLRKPFSAAVDFYRELEELSTTLAYKVLQLKPLGILAIESCPACFGPRPANTHEYPDATRNLLCVCLDANFQHRHHTKASHANENVQMPRIFITTNDIQEMADIISAKEEESSNKKQQGPPDRCTKSFKAADDQRSKSTWKGCDDTGLMGCCCRHDSVIYMANIYKSGEKRSLPMVLLRKLFLDVEPDRKVGILYDIGCSLDKFCQLRQLLIEERPRIQFGTSVFHAYAHNWLCQLGYHPRFNVGWGLSDGEGLERMWSFLSPLIGPLRYSTRSHRLHSIAHRLKHHNSRDIKKLPRWLCKKFNAAITRQIQTRLILQQLLRQPNPFDSQGRNYKKSFFKQQWASQREFRHHRTGPEDERRCKLVELYEKEATVARLRKELSSPKVLQRTEDELADLIENIETGTEEVQLLKEELTEEEGVHIDDKEQRLLLLLWSAKTELFLQASYKQAEMQPITDSQTIGTRLGTKGREKVFQALRDRESVVARALNLYNKRYTDYVAEYPDKAPATQYEHPLSYDEFSAFPLDDAFWNDGIYYQSKEPWAIDPNVCSGINCVLILSRIQEEFQLIAQELARMVEWAISHYHTLFKSINYLRGRIVQMSIPNTAVPPDYIDEIPFGDGKCSRVLKVTYIKQDLQQRTWEHGTLVEEWSEKVAWLWPRCQPHTNRPALCRWFELTKLVRQHRAQLKKKRGIKEVGLELDHLQEDTVLDERVNDGEDAASQFLANRGEVDPLAQINGVHV